MNALMAHLGVVVFVSGSRVGVKQRVEIDEEFFAMVAKLLDRSAHLVSHTSESVAAVWIVVVGQ